MHRSLTRLALMCLIGALFFVNPPAVFAQGTNTLSGTVVDSSGAVIPGADVSAKHIGTGVASTTVSNSEGVFSIPSLPIGTYTVTVSLQGFKTVVINDVVLTTGAGADVKATLEVGGVEEQVTVSSSSEIVPTQSSGVSTTVNTNQIQKIPITSRSAMDFVNLLPGVSSPNGNRNAIVNGLPRTAINITLDGVNIQDNTNKGSNGDDGFFAIVSPRLDAIEEVTVSSAGQGADATGDGAVQIKFVTRSGTNTFAGSGYEYFRSDKLNANTWFNNRNGVAKPKLKQNQFGFRVGGPIMLPWFDGHNKAFFFVNYEELRQPSDTTRTRTMLNTSAQAGNFCYATGCVNVLALAAANGQISAVDPTIGKLLNDMRSSTSAGAVSATDVNLDRFVYNVPVQSMRRFPTARVDYNITDNHRYNVAWNYQKFTDTPDTLNSLDPNFPGFPVQAGQSSVRMSLSNGVRSTLTKNMVNEASVAFSYDPVRFFDELNAGMFTGSLANQQGFAIGFPSVGSNLTSPGANPSPQSRNATTLDIRDTVTWLRGSHNITMGGVWSRYHVWLKNSTLVPRATIGMLSNDPANAMFSAANFPGASPANLTAAQNLYALLTGRLTAINGDARIDSSGSYVFEGTGIQLGRLNEMAGFAQDQWRIRQNLTINAGVRYDLQFPFSSENNSYTFVDMANMCGLSGTNGANSCNVFQPGNVPGAHTVFQQYKAGTKSFNLDKNNLAPSAGIAWTPQARPGFLGSLMGAGDFVARAGFARSFSRPAIGDFTSIFNTNPGITIPVQRNAGNGLLLSDGLGAPILLSQSGRLNPAPFNATPTYPIASTGITSLAGFAPDTKIPYSDSFQAGITRSIGKNMALEVRYVGTRGHDDWGLINFNAQDVIQNGFLKEFRTAQANLAANLANGKGSTFAYTGVPGTAPLPIFLAYYNAQPTTNAGNAALYTGSNWTNTTFLGFLSPLNPNPFGFASFNTTNGLQGNATFRGNALTAGLPANFFVANPDILGAAQLRTNLENTRYNSLQIELRRRYAQGLQFQTSYVFGHEYDSTYFGFTNPSVFRRNTGDPGDLTHAIKANVVYDLPFGQGRRWGSNANGLVDRLIGGWQLGISSNVHSGRLVDLGNVRLVGMTKADVQKMFQLRFDNAGKQVYMLPQDVIDNTILAFAVSPTSASGYAGASPTGRYFAPANGPDCLENENGSEGPVGNCGTGQFVVTGPLFQQHDIRISKRTTVVGHTNFEFAAEMLNAFNHPNFLPVGGLGSSTISGYQLTGLQGTNTARVIQLVARFNW
jgi:carboxypeptidase family protein/TonB-dependent receptor-like protein